MCCYDFLKLSTSSMSRFLGMNFLITYVNLLSISESFLKHSTQIPSSLRSILSQNVHFRALTLIVQSRYF
jgi:hypothetical protein